MSIKPIDHNVMVPKTQEVSKAKQVENLKNRNVVEREFIQQEKTIRNNSQKVTDTEKSASKNIHKDQKSNSQGNSKGKGHKKREEPSIEQRILNTGIGSTIDIHI